MLVHVISLSFLIAVIMLIRAVFRRSVSPNIMYALWLAVLLKLCLPFSLFEADFSFLRTSEQTNIVTDSEQVIALPKAENTYAPIYDPDLNSAVKENIPEPNLSDTAVAEDNFVMPRLELHDVLAAVWIGGSVTAALFFAISGIVFSLRLRGDRELYKMLGHTRVYISDTVGTPCLAGLKPSIYLTHDVASLESNSMILAHEYTHLRHGDHIWSLLRTLAVIVYWWNPFVWAAAILSKQDAELACDYSVTKSMSDTERIDYARVIVDMIPKKHGYAVGLGGGSVKDRIIMLAKGGKKRVTAAVMALVLVISAVGCSFIGEKDESDEAVSVPIDTEYFSYANEDFILTLPHEYTEYYEINPEGEEMPEDAVFALYYKPAYERMQGASFGLMLLVYQYTRGELEALLASDGSGRTPFATDGEYYYILAYPTDVTYDPLKDENFGEISSACKDMILTSMVSANGWSVYDTDKAYNEPTYDSDHVFLKYYPYRAYPGILAEEESEAFYYTLMLSQPADKGEDGMWCVERWNAENNRYTKLVFPDSGDMAAVDYYADAQLKYKLAGDIYYNDPMNAALSWVKEYFGHDAATLDSFELSDITSYPQFVLNSAVEPLEDTVDDVTETSEDHTDSSEDIVEEGIKTYPTIVSMFADIGDAYGLYPIEKYEFAAYSFVNPDEYREELGEAKYERLKELDITEYNFHYVNDEQNFCRIYISFYVNGSTLAALVPGWNKCEINSDIRGCYIRCGDFEGMNSSEASQALADYIAFTGNYKFPEDEMPDMYDLCAYIISRLEAKGVSATADAIIAYGKKCFNVDVAIPDSLIYNEDSGTYTYAGRGGIERPHLVVGEYASPWSPVNLSVWYYTDESCILESHLYDYMMKKADGDWVFTSSTMAVYSPYEPGMYVN